MQMGFYVNCSQGGVCVGVPHGVSYMAACAVHLSCSYEVQWPMLLTYTGYRL